MQKINVVLFDLDGTLVNSNDLLINSFDHTFNHYFPDLQFTRDDYIHMIGPSLKKTFSKYETSMVKVKEMIQFFRKYYTEHETKSIDIYPNLIKTLQRLKSAHIQTGIVTTKFKESAIPSIQLFNLDAYIDIYVFLDDVENPKPHPDPIYYAESLLDNVDKMLIVGDNPSDIISGKNANILTCGVAWSYKREALLETKPDFWLKDFKDLLPMIQKYNRR
ncbi:MAG TPA: HAD-IA family hydrolase [Candidatus Izemoplasmatales bacterium]|nr:HAD-IA family hydrolase [Candidatus Izemoplasmatales bacterium]